MKKLKALILFLCIWCALPAQQPAGTIFEHGTLDEALTKAAGNKKGPRLVFLDCYTTWCGPCKNMTEKIFPLARMGAFFNSSFVNIKIDMEKGEGPELAKKFDIRAYPTFLILDIRGNEVGRIVGGGDADEFIARVKKAMEPGNSPSARLEAYQADSSFSNAFAYLEALQDAYLLAEQNTFLGEHFASFQPNEKYSDKMWPFLRRYLSVVYSSSGVFNDMVKNYSKACEAFGADRVNELLSRNILQYIPAYLSGQIKGAGLSQLEQRVRVLTFTGGDDKLAGKLCDIANCVIRDNYQEMANIFHPYFLSSFPAKDRSIVERTVLAIKDKIDPAILSYYYSSMEVSSKKMAEDYSKQAGIYKSGN